MYEIMHRIGVEARPDTVYELVATIEGLQRWWTTDTRGNSAIGEKISFHFGGPDRFMVMEVVELDVDQRVKWRCIDGETILNFTHIGWREPVEFMGHCSSKWGSYLLSLKQGVEHGAAHPFPHDVKMSRFD